MGKLEEAYADCDRAVPLRFLRAGTTADILIEDCVDDDTLPLMCTTLDHVRANMAEDNQT